MISALVTGMAVQAAEPKLDWRAIAIADVSAAYRLYAENHPGMVNPDDPEFPARLAATRDASLKIARETRDWNGYDQALDVFTEGLSDGHAFVVASDEPGKVWGERIWPGFIAAWRGNGLFVYHAGTNSPVPMGSQILSCDGEPVTKLLRQRNRGLWFRPDEAGQWWNVGPTLLIGSSPPDEKLLQRCTFQLPDGKVREAKLPWESQPKGTHERFQQAFAGEKTPIGLSEPRPGVWLIGLPTFSPDEKGIAAYGQLYADIDRERTRLRSAKAIVLDLRFNGGGSWEWGHDVARHLWGERAVNERMNYYFRNVRIAWRASPDNLAAMGARVAQLRAQGHDEAAAHQLVVSKGMESALAEGKASYFERAILGDGRAVEQSPTDLHTPVYVITHGGCVSACLDALDVFKRFDNVKQIGAPTSADTLYMDLRSRPMPLPSGYGNFIIPLKTWINRPRKSGEVYQPDIPFNDLDWSTKSFLDRIERDLQSTGAAPASR